MPDAYKKIQIRVSIYEWRRFKEFQEKGLSVREVIEYSSCPCDRCKGVNVIAFDKIDGEPIEIPRGILTKKNR
jgi:hypothetical protein